MNMPLLKLLTFYKCLLHIFFKVKVAERHNMRNILYMLQHITNVQARIYTKSVLTLYNFITIHPFFFFSNVNSILSILLYIIKPVSNSLQLQQNSSFFFFSSVYYISLNLLKCLLYIIKPMSNSLHLHARAVYKKL